MKQAIYVIMGLFLAQISSVAHGGPVFSAFGRATIDGQQSPDEWDRAAKFDFRVNEPGGGTKLATLMIMNDGTSLFVGLKIMRPLGRSSFYLEFDNDHQEDWPKNGDDAIGLTVDGGRAVFSDAFRTNASPCPPGNPPGNCGFADTSAGGTSDGEGKAADGGTFSFYEMSHPLRSGDVGHDFSVRAGDTLGFQAFITLCDPCMSTYVGGGDIVIATVGPAITVIPQKIVFPATRQGETSSGQVLIVHSGSATVLKISRIETSLPFALSGALPANIPPAGSASLSITFSPTGAGPYAGAVTITSNAPTSPTRIALEGQVVTDSSPDIQAVVNAASFRQAPYIVPGSIFTIFGRRFGSQDNLAAFPATEFEGLSVTFNGLKAPFFHVIASRGQLNVQVPWELPESGWVEVQVQSPAGASSVVRLQILHSLPGIFYIPNRYNSEHRNAAATLAGTSWIAMPRFLAQLLGVPDTCRGGEVHPASVCGEPARRGEVIQVYTTGLGRATPWGDPRGDTLPSGEVAPATGNPLYQTAMLPLVTVGGVPAQVFFSGLAPGFAGLFQVNIMIPESAPVGDYVPIRIMMPDAGRQSDTTTIAIE